MRYQVIGRAKCYNCGDWTINTLRTKPEGIEAENEAAAEEKFKRDNRLCPMCLATGTNIAVELMILSVEEVPELPKRFGPE